MTASSAPKRWRRLADTSTGSCLLASFAWPCRGRSRRRSDHRRGLVSGQTAAAPAAALPRRACRRHGGRGRSANRSRPANHCQRGRAAADQAYHRLEPDCHQLAPLSAGARSRSAGLSPGGRGLPHPGRQPRHRRDQSPTLEWSLGLARPMLEVDGQVLLRGGEFVAS